MKIARSRRETREFMGFGGGGTRLDCHPCCPSRVATIPPVDEDVPPIFFASTQAESA